MHLEESVEGPQLGVGSKTHQLDDSQVLSPYDIRRNMICVVMLDAIFFGGWADVALSLQPLLVYLHASNTMIGLITGANWAGLLGVFLSPWITRRFRFKKWYMVVVHIPYLAAIAIAGLGVVFSKRLGMTEPHLLLFLLCIFLSHWFFGGFVSLPHQEYVAATIPMSHRGRMTGYSFTIGGILSIVAAAVGGVILLRLPKPMSFGYLFLMAWVIIQSGYICALFAKERPTPVESSPPAWSKSMIKAVWNDKPYLKFLSINILSCALILPIFPFVNIYGFNSLHAGGLGMNLATAAVIQMVTQIIRIAFSSLLGMATDRIGAKNILPYWMLVASAALLPPILLHNAWGVYISVAISTIFMVGVTSCFTALIYGLPKPENRGGHFTVQLILVYVAASVGPVLIGKASDISSLKTVFIIWACIALAFFLLAKYAVSSLSSDLESYS